MKDITACQRNWRMDLVLILVGIVSVLFIV